jgi:hypothetical protein
VDRRACLLAATALVARQAVHAQSPAPVQGPAPACVERPVCRLVWCADAVAALDARGVAQPLPTPPSTAPVVTGGGVWHATRDGRLQRWRWHDGWRLQAEAVLPEPAHALADAEGGVLAAHGHLLTLLDADANLRHRWPGADLARRRTGAATSLHALPHRRSLLAAWPALHEWWEISLDPAAPPIFDGYVHDHRMGEAIASRGFLGLRRVPFDAEAPQPAFVPAGWPWVACATPAGLSVVHLDVRRTVARLDLVAAAPAVSVMHAGLWWLQAAHGLQVVDPRRWQPLQHIDAPGPVQALSVGDGTLHLLSRGRVWRRMPGGWQPAGDGVAAMASGGDGPILAAPPPWCGVAALTA